MDHVMSKLLIVLSLFFSPCAISDEPHSKYILKVENSQLIVNGKRISLGESSKGQLVQVFGSESHHFGNPIWIDKGVSAIDYYLDESCIQSFTVYLERQLIAVGSKDGWKQYERTNGFNGNILIEGTRISRETHLSDVQGIGAPVKNRRFPTFLVGGREVKFWFKGDHNNQEFLHQVTISKHPDEECQAILNERK